MYSILYCVKNNIRLILFTDLLAMVCGVIYVYFQDLHDLLLMYVAFVIVLRFIPCVWCKIELA